MGFTGKICKIILFKCLGWREQVSVGHRNKCIIAVAPHTSNWDFVIGELYYAAIGRRANFLMKSSWFFWPLGFFFRKIGGIPVNRSQHTSLTTILAETAMKADHFELAITPEGTRSLSKEWKRGFYFIAAKAQLPIQLFGLDYKNKVIVCSREIMPSGNVEDDFRVIMDYYAQFEGKAKHPENFAIESRN